MKRKIAICANGWNYDTLSRAMEGIKRYAQKEDFDIFNFLSFASYSEHKTLMQGELNIYNLMDPMEYDGVIVFSTMLNSTETAISLCKKVKEMGKPVVSVGMDIDGIPSIHGSNREGMGALVKHLIEKHNVKRAVYVGGTPDHVDSIERLQVTKEVFEEYGLKLEEDDIGYGRWSNRYTVELVERVINSEKGLPDAFICANDIMALAASTLLEEKGYNVPGDVIVTGFDNSGEGMLFYPALTSVKQNYEEVGYQCCEMLFEQLRGIEGTAQRMVPSEFVCGESCGCRGDMDFERMHLLYCKHSFRRNMDAKLLEQNERNMRQRLSDVPNYRVMKSALQDHYRVNHQFEGSGFYIVLNSEYFEDPMASEQELFERGYAGRLEVVIALRNGEIQDGLKVDRQHFIPGYEKKTGEQHVYSLLPLHFYEYNYGYLVLTDQPTILMEDMLYPYLEKLQQSMKLLRINLRLKNLYDKDQMTGLFNRFGYENKALPLYQESLRDKMTMMVMFVDINYMKHINDKYGHLHGDNAIRTVVAAIKAKFTEEDEAIAVRFGGDEFLIIAKNFDILRAESIKQGILDFLEGKNREATLPYKITVSIGYVITDPEERPKASLQDYIREADNLMYKVKAMTHAKDPEYAKEPEKAKDTNPGNIEAI